MSTYPDPLYDDDGRVSLAVYDYLDEATPEERTEMVLKLIEEHPKGRLELPMRDGHVAALWDIDLSHEAIALRLKATAETDYPKWACRRRIPGCDYEQPVVNLQNAHLAGASMMGANLDWADLSGARLESADLVAARLLGAFLTSTHLENADLFGADLAQADLNSAHWEGVILIGACLVDAQLSHCHLEQADLLFATMINLHFRDAKFHKTRFYHTQLGSSIVEEKDRAYFDARFCYLELKQNFQSLGDYVGASWAYCKERRMEKLEALHNGYTAERAGNWPQALKHYAKAALDQLVELVCDYGEGFWNIIACLAVVWFDFALLYAITGHVLADRGTQYVTTRNLVDLASFSLGTMVTIEPPGLIAYDSLLMRFLMPLQAFLGIFLAGLLGFVAGNRIRRS